MPSRSLQKPVVVLSACNALYRTVAASGKDCRWFTPSMFLRVRTMMGAASLGIGCAINAPGMSATF